jgi:hypothetical protein
MICAFQEGDAQFPCDPGCCGPPPTGATGGDGTTTGGDGTTTSWFPLWAIILLIVLGTIFMAVLIALAAKKMSKNK